MINTPHSYKLSCLFGYNRQILQFYVFCEFYYIVLTIEVIFKLSQRFCHNSSLLNYWQLQTCQNVFIVVFIPFCWFVWWWLQFSMYLVVQYDIISVSQDSLYSKGMLTNYFGKFCYFDYTFVEINLNVFTFVFLYNIVFCFINDSLLQVTYFIEFLIFCRSGCSHTVWWWRWHILL